MGSLEIGIVVLVVGVIAYAVYSSNSKKKVASKPSVSPAPAPAPVVEAKAAAPAKAKAPSKAELNKLTKKAIDDKAAEVGIKLDARKTKESMIKDFQSEFKKLK